MGAEQERVETLGRLENGLREGGEWYLWGPYLSERQWGTVREDYSPGGTAWDYLSHDHARSRAYRWGEDGIGGVSGDPFRRGPVGGLLERGGPVFEKRGVGPSQHRGEERRGGKG